MAGLALTGNPFYSCRKCRTPVALRDDLLSKNFRVTIAQTCKRKLSYILKHHMIIHDVYCRNCSACLGWKYIRAYDAREKYKEGRFVIEKAKILKEY